LKLCIASIAEAITTARYFEAAARAAGHEVAAVECLSGRNLVGTDAVLVFDPWMRDLSALSVGPCPTLGLMIDVHRGLAWRHLFARYLDHVFVAQAEYVEGFAALPHPSVTWLPLGCDPNVHYVAGLKRDIDVGFVGKLGTAGTERFETLNRVLDAFETNDYHRSYAPQEMGRTYSRAKIVFSKSIGGDVNMRFFEGLASGALLVTDRIGNGLGEIGREGEHYVAYDTPEEAIALIRHYLTREDERTAIAARGQALAFAQHTYAHRLDVMLGVLQASRGTPMESAAPARGAPRATERHWRSEWMRMMGAAPSEALRFAAGGVTAGMATNISLGLARFASRRLRAIAQRR
jgi:hypothetical protein